MIQLSTAIPEKYEKTAIFNLLNLRLHMGFEHPIEVWEAGEELSEEGRHILSNMSGVTLRNTTEFDDRAQFWRGFQIKAPAMLYSSADHFIWCDADAHLFQNPTKLLNTELYTTTGSYIFRDFPDWNYNSFVEDAQHHFNSIPRYLARRRFVRELFPVKPEHFPSEWDHLYIDTLPTEPAAEAHAETGVFAIDRTRHADVIRTFYNLNYHHEYSYKYVHGDKELLWMSFLLHKKPYGIHPDRPQWNGGKPLQGFEGAGFYV